MTCPAGPSSSRIVLSAEDLRIVVQDLARRIAEDFFGEDLRLVTVLKGGLFFTSDLCRAISEPLSLDFVSIQAYEHGAGGVVRLTKDLSDDIEGASVVLVEDVIDTGLTANYVLRLLRSHGPRRLGVCALFDKPSRRIADVPITYTGLTMPDEFLVGYGMDYHGRYRNLPYVATIPDQAVF